MSNSSTFDDSCIFCRVVAGEIPAERLYETDDVLAFPDINPAAPTHWLFIPKQHTPMHAETDDAVLATLLGAARDLAKHKGLEHYRLVINNGPDAGQTVFHLHVHLLAGRGFTWPPG